MTEIKFSNTIFHLPFNMMAAIEYIINLQQKGFSQHSQRVRRDWDALCNRSDCRYNTGGWDRAKKKKKTNR